MKKANQEKGQSLLEADSFEVTAVKNPDHRPFLNVFKLEGKNVAQNKLGQVFGVIQVENHSKNSEYIPNLLTQVIKREFFKAPKQETGESFEKALHKANLALTDLAQHEIIEWMGGFNAAIGVIKNEEFHFVQVGRAKVLLLRDKKLSDITPNENQNSITHPIKTFSSISSGKLFPGDKIILIPENALEFLSQEEMERHSKTFTSDEFDNILSSTLQSDGDQTGGVVVNIKEKKLPTEEKDYSPEKTSKSEKDVNFFGKTEKEKSSQVNMKKEEIHQQDNFQETLVEQEDMESLIKEKKDEAGEEPSTQKEEVPQEEYDQDIPPFEKEPEIHLKEKDFPEDLEKELQEKEERLKPDLFRDIKDKITEKKDSLCKSASSFFQEISLKNFFKSLTEKTTLLLKKIQALFCRLYSQAKNALQNFFEKIRNGKGEDKRDEEKQEEKKEKSFSVTKSEKAASAKKDKIAAFFNKDSEKKLAKKSVSLEKLKTIINSKFKKANPKKMLSYFSTLWSKFKNTSFWAKLNQSLNTRKKKIIITVSFVILAGVVSALAVNFFPKSNPSHNQADNPSEKQTPVKDVGEQLDNLSQIASFKEKIKNSTQMEGILFFLTENDQLIQFNPSENNQTKISLPEEAENPRYLAAIPSLQLVFVVSEEAIFSYSPVTGNFFSNRISLPFGFDNSKGVGTYLTYLYLPNKEDGQIYRYPRSSGGFGSPVKWLDNPIKIEKAIDISVSDSIYIAFEDGFVSKFFQGKEMFKASLTEEEFTPFKVKAGVDAESFFVLDKDNGKIVKFDTDNGDFLESFADDKFKKSKDFQVDFNQKKFYIVDKEDNLLVFKY
ncbi:MAG: hypothetical protein ACOCUF_00480 [Patescibacteria group bacterium]